jgi:putative transposase
LRRLSKLGSGVGIEPALSARIIEIADRRRAGYRMLHDLLRPDNPRIYRLYSEANLAVQSKGQTPQGACTLGSGRTVNQTWSMDFVSNSVCTGRRLTFLTVADDFSHEFVLIAVDFGMGAVYVTRLLDEAAVFCGYTKVVRTDNGDAHISGRDGLAY